MYYDQMNIIVKHNKRIHKELAQLINYIDYNKLADPDSFKDVVRCSNELDKILRGINYEDGSL